MNAGKAAGKGKCKVKVPHKKQQPPLSRTTNLKLSA